MNGRELTIWDVGGQDKIRVLWRHYFQNTHILTYMIDANDRERLDDALEALDRCLNEDELAEAKALVLLNVKHQEGAITLPEFIQNEQFQRIRGSAKNPMHVA
jgi:ADP-ribosylation factor protein 1